MRRRFAAPVALAVLFSPERASANAAAPFSRPTGAVPGLVVERRSPVVVEREDLLIDCADGPLHPRCRFTATYHLRNPTGDEEELAGAFYALERARSEVQEQTDVVDVTLDGVDVRSDLGDELQVRLDQIVRKDAEVAAILANADGGALVHSGFRITLAAGRRARLVFSGELKPIGYRDEAARDGYVFPAIYTRHPFVTGSGAAEWSGSAEDFIYLVSPIAEWAGEPDVFVTVRHHPQASFHPQSGDAMRFERAAASGVVSERTVLRGAGRRNIRFGLRRAAPVFHLGGPVFGIGPRIAREELRVRLGWEVGLFRSLVLDTVVETNFDYYLNAAMTLNAASPSVLGIIPSLGLGAGGVAQLRDGVEPRGGVRGQLTVSLAMLSFAFPIDYFPAASSSGSHFEGAFLTQLSF